MKYIKFKPKYEMKCECTWCGKEDYPTNMNMYVKEIKRNFLKPDEITSWMQLCPSCQTKMTNLCQKIYRER